jgi:Zn finger protein HypA/HybF involved in hydrogenase expression
MGIIQKIAAKLDANAEAESRSWQFTCSACSAVSSAWDLGWVITGTRSKGHTRKVECPKCHAKVTATLSKVGG